MHCGPLRRMMKTVNKMIPRFIRKLIFGGSAKFRDYEVKILKATRSILPESDQAIFDAQLSGPLLIQRTNSDRMVAIFLEKPNESHKLMDCTASKMLTLMTLEHSTGRIDCSVFTHDGLLSTIEFNSSPKALSIQKIMIKKPTGRSLASEIDNFEHGSNE